MKPGAILILCGLLAPGGLLGCDGDNPAFDPGNGLTDPSGAGSGAADCAGDPDTGRVQCVPAEVWDCSALPNQAKQCRSQSPDGEGGWICRHQPDGVTCSKREPNAAAGGGIWDCVSDEFGTTCTSGSAQGAPTGRGQWGCEGQEHGVTCTEETPDDVPLDGGTSQCFCPAKPDDSKSTLGSGPVATVLTGKTTYNGVAARYARVTFSRAFNDNTYGAGSSPCWRQSKKGEHQFKHLVGSDAAELLFTCNGHRVLGAQIDYISESSAPSGYGSLCVAGGDGKLTGGNPDDVLACETSLDVNFNRHSYVLTSDSPAFDNYGPSPGYEQWIYDVWYGVWVREAALSGECTVSIEYVHASPACGGSNSIDVVPCPC